MHPAKELCLPPRPLGVGKPSKKRGSGAVAPRLAGIASPSASKTPPPTRVKGSHSTVGRCDKVRKPRDKFAGLDHDCRMDMDFDACYRALLARESRFDGCLFVGVRTTGIYCRPICPARTPKRENITFFATATAAQVAGFRPCLRCRPESSPDFAAWRGTSNTVSRALALIEAGALDDENMDALASRLDVGERQLRRLFRRHLGASPISVAQTRRVLLAKQLIHQTRLPMTEVALASGFSSLRRFNESFQRLYDRAPIQLRRQSGETPAGEDGVRLDLAYRSPYDWDGLIGFLGPRAIEGVEVVSTWIYARTIAIGDDRGVLTVEPGTRPGRLSATIRFPRLTALPGIIARIRRVFDLTADPQAIGAHLSKGTALAPRVAARPGLRVPGAWDGFELAVRAVLGQQITVTAATRLAARIVREWGEPLQTGMRGGVAGLTHIFPSPERLADADLSVLPMPKARSAALRALARAVVDDPTIFHPRIDLPQAVSRLKRLAGIGEWTAQYIAMRQLRQPDAFPSGDIGLMRAMAGANGRRPIAGALQARAETWRPWRAYAALHLWTSEAMPDPLAASEPPATESLHDWQAA
jgi:AraC family transcriptional regulator of adaptative response / DNA-3-methyladenine glycosylase II